jgi:hypothetical protein
MSFEVSMSIEALREHGAEEIYSPAMALIAGYQNTKRIDLVNNVRESGRPIWAGMSE